MVTTYTYPWADEHGVSWIVWDEPKNEEGDRDGDTSEWPEAWWNLGNEGEKGWGIGLTWYDSVFRTDFIDFPVYFPTPQEARSWALSFQRRYGGFLTAKAAVDRWLTDAARRALEPTCEAVP